MCGGNDFKRVEKYLKVVHPRDDSLQSVKDPELRMMITIIEYLSDYQLSTRKTNNQTITRIKTKAIFIYSLI